MKIEGTCGKTWGPHVWVTQTAEEPPVTHVRQCRGCGKLDLTELHAMMTELRDDLRAANENMTILEGIRDKRDQELAVVRGQRNNAVDNEAHLREERATLVDRIKFLEKRLSKARQEMNTAGEAAVKEYRRRVRAESTRPSVFDQTLSELRTRAEAAESERDVLSDQILKLIDITDRVVGLWARSLET